MAIYIRTIGVRKIDKEEIEIERLDNILRSTNLNLDFLIENHRKIDRSEWKLLKTEHHCYFELDLHGESIKVLLDNPNFIEFISSNGWDIRDFGRTEENKNYINGIKSIYQAISSKYGLSELYYFSEWFFDPDSIREGLSSFKEFKKIIESNPYIKMPKFWDEWPNNYVIEKVNPVANTV